jgi:hypothetical protein
LRLPRVLSRALLFGFRSAGYTLLPIQTCIPIPVSLLFFLEGCPEGENLEPNYRDTNQANYRGALHYNVNVSPIEDAANFMRRLGLKVTLPPSLTTLRDGKQQPGAWQFLDLNYENSKSEPPPGIPGSRSVGLLEYQNNDEPLAERSQRALELIDREVQDSRRTRGELHANTARKLKSVWVAVSSLSDAVKQSQLLGFEPGRERQLAALGARGQEIQCGSGTIVFWEAIENTGRLSKFMKDWGVGPFGFSVEVGDLNRAHEIVEKGTGNQLPLEKVDGRQSFIVPGDNAAGVWIEFVEK